MAENVERKKAGTAPSSPPPLGKYRLIRVLGQGGMGVVYEALDAQLGRKVALKTMIVLPHANPKDAKLDEDRFLREARLAAGLAKHPNIVGVYEAGILEGRRYIAMELVDGLPMSEWREAPSITIRQQVEVLRDAALAVHHAHEHGIIHRDLKPPNILVDGKNQPHITDFGLAKMVGENLGVSLTGAGMVVGTPAYISPEQAQGLKTTDRRTDVYALGVILYESMTGRPPFIGNTAMEILMKAVQKPVPSPSSLMRAGVNPALFKGLESICLKALAKKVHERYPDAAALSADLTRWLKGEEIRISIRTRRAIPVHARRKWGVALAAGAILVAGLVAGLVASSRSSRSEDETREQLRALEEKLAREKRAVEERAKSAEQKLHAIESQALRGVIVREDALRPGLVAEYCGGTNFDIPSLRRIDREIAFPAKEGPAWADGPADHFSIRWKGFLRAPETGAYVFQTRSHDGVRLFIDGAEVISSWTVRPASVDSGITMLEKGFHRIEVDHFQAARGVGLSFAWRKGSDAGGPGLEPAFFHDPGQFAPMARKAVWEHIDWEPLPGAQEADTLPVLERSGGETFVLPFGRKKTVLVWGKKVKPEDRLKVQFAAPAAGRATLVLCLGRSKNSGIVRIVVNGAVLANRLDLYSAHNIVLETEFKNVALREGKNELEFTMVGTNPAAVEWNRGDGLYKMSFDYLRLR